jgi:hypothetical protein
MDLIKPPPALDAASTSSAAVAPPARPLYRVQLRQTETAVSFCLSRNVVGVGWGVQDSAPGQELDWPAYVDLATALYGGVKEGPALVHSLPSDSLVWLRDKFGTYYLAEVSGDWQYLPDDESVEADVHNVRPARIERVGVESQVPGAVIAAFRPPRTLQAVRNVVASRYSEFLFAKLAGRELPAWKPSVDEVLTSLLSSQDLEDLISCYLQRRYGYLMMPGNTRPDTLAYEFVLRHPDDGHEAVLQVKSGHSAVHLDALPTDFRKAFVFSPSDSYTGQPAANVEKLLFANVIDFMTSEPFSLPRRVENWVRYATGADE